MVATSNVYNLVLDPGAYSAALGSGTFYQANSTFGGTPDNPDCNGTQANTLLNCLTQSKFLGNVMLATYANSLPGSQTDYPQGSIATTQALFPAGSYWPNQSTMALRIASLGWSNSESLDFHYLPSSPYISGGHLTPDGLPMGIDQEKLIVAQGQVQAVTATALETNGTQSGFTVQWVAPDSFVCSVDYSNAGPFWSNPGAYAFSRFNGSVYLGRVQRVSLSNLFPPHSTVYYRVNCSVQQPTGTVSLP